MIGSDNMSLRTLIVSVFVVGWAVLGTLAFGKNMELSKKENGSFNIKRLCVQNVKRLLFRLDSTH